MRSADARSDSRARVATAALVWIDSREARVVRIGDEHATVQRIESEVPAHHRATGHVRHQPSMRHGGGRDQTAGEDRRLEHLARFVEAVTAELADVDDVLLLGPGTVREHLERRLGETSRPVGRPALRIATESAARATDRQLIARLRHHLGEDPRQRTIGAYRWSGPLPRDPSGRLVGLPERVSEKRPRQK
jgi:hypothetical protein